MGIPGLEGVGAVQPAEGEAPTEGGSGGGGDPMQMLGKIGKLMEGLSKACSGG